MILDKHIIRQIREELERFSFPEDLESIANTRLFGLLKGVECALIETGINFKITAQANLRTGIWKFYVEAYQYDNYADFWSENKLIMTVFKHRVEYHAENENTGKENENK